MHKKEIRTVMHSTDWGTILQEAREMNERAQCNGVSSTEPFVRRCECEKQCMCYVDLSDEAKEWVIGTECRGEERAAAKGYGKADWRALLVDCAQWLESDRADARAWKLLARVGKICGDCELVALGTTTAERLSVYHKEREAYLLSPFAKACARYPSLR